jgi:predicted phage baseplate assembly protein
VRIDDDARATVVFGDGESGARLPTGLENAHATYRSGIGPDGSVDAGSLTLLQTRPYGIKSVTNPIRASGAAAPEAIEEARTNAPLTVLTLDRIVSVQDFEDFARAFAGIGKARAEILWDGESRFVHITVAAADGTEVAPDSDLARNLVAAIDLARDDVPDVVVETFRPLTFDVAARVLVDDAYEFDAVVELVRAAVEEAFSFDTRTFAQPVTRAELIATIQGVEGVVASTLGAFHYTGTPEEVAERLDAEPAAAFTTRGYGGPMVRRTHAAQLLLVNPAGITFGRMPR